MSTPKKLYKYESVSIQSLKNLNSQTIYFSAPAAFNDPYDSAIKAKLKEPTLEELEKLKSIYLKKEASPEILRKLAAIPALELRSILMGAAKEANKSIIDKFMVDKGVSCFSEVKDELLMWAHYSDKYTGFCLEFDTKNEIFQKAKKVNYSSSIPKLNMLRTYGQRERNDIVDLFCTKSNFWRYEREWRCINQKANTTYTYPMEALTGIYFGPLADSNLIEIICLIIQAKTPEIRFWKGKMSESSFKIDFEEFTCTSYVEAERRKSI